jgi:hypothetical protein
MESRIRELEKKIKEYRDEGVAMRDAFEKRKEEIQEAVKVIEEEKTVILRKIHENIIASIDKYLESLRNYTFRYDTTPLSYRKIIPIKNIQKTTFAEASAISHQILVISWNASHGSSEKKIISLEVRKLTKGTLHELKSTLMGHKKATAIKNKAKLEEAFTNIEKYMNYKNSMEDTRSMHRTIDFFLDDYFKKMNMLYEASKSYGI